MPRVATDDVVVTGSGGGCDDDELLQLDKSAAGTSIPAITAIRLRRRAESRAPNCPPDRAPQSIPVVVPCPRRIQTRKSGRLEMPEWPLGRAS
jgi:hypothetical protein